MLYLSILLPLLHLENIAAYIERNRLSFLFALSPAANRSTASAGRCRSRPVVVVLHGGRFQFGGGGTYAFYDGRRASLLWDTVVVVPAYRVGAFGFLNMLVPEAPGNVGLMDQALALRWVHRFIHYFGGDNRRITILGQDAGASAIGFHLARNETPFQRAILMSGSPFTPLHRNSGQRAVINGNALANVLGCGRRDVRDASARQHVVACLRKRSVSATVMAADQLATSSDLVVYAPSATRDYPWKLGGPTWSKAGLRSVDFLVGVARDEGTLHVSELMQAFGLAADQTLTPRRLLSVFRVFLESHGVQDVESVVHHYGLDRPGVLDDTLGQLFLLELARPMGDFLIYCPALFFLEEASSVGGRAFLYEFGYSPSYRTWPSWQGVPQFVDFVFATGLLDALDTIQPASSRDKVLAHDFAATVAAFTRNG
ncbi:hypothetical protein V5799_023353 [Amblyomma americanum]|uniref:Carboxylesterase type B domain-containing protein n=1 Tax=Amblyomma americanum TaxID=6943 RepID=A0AAQ4FJW8_AMBAM